MGTSTYVIILVILVILSAYFSATETAFSSLNKTKIKTLAEKDDKKAILVLKLVDKYDKLISTILIGNNIVNIAASSIATMMFVKHFGDIGATISTAVLTVVILIFGEISPKSIAKDCPEKFAMFSAPFINLLSILLAPLNFLFSCWKKLLSKVFRLEADTKMSQEELLMLVEEVQQDGSIDESEGDLLKNAIEFTEQEAEDILTHRVDLEAVSVDATKEEIAQVFYDTKFSRILVYEDSIDNIIGVIHQKDFYTATGITTQNIREVISPVVYVMKNEKISPLLRQLQKAKSHIAVVLDEYGGTYGIVTMEDILEELVGEIWDEHDDVVEEITEVSADTHRVDASTALDEFCEFFDVETESEMISLGGWVAEQLGKVPEEGDCFQYDNLEIRVLSVDTHRVEEIEIHQLPKASDEDEEEGSRKD